MLRIETARAVRADRLGKIRRAGLAFSLVEGAKVVVHRIPLRRNRVEVCRSALAGRSW
jgi:hypothetical protein